jgi:hypothetical protein
LGQHTAALNKLMSHPSHKNALLSFNSVLFSRLGSEFHDSGYARDLLRLSRREINEFYAIAEPVAVADYCADAQNHP